MTPLTQKDLDNIEANAIGSHAFYNTSRLTGEVRRLQAEVDRLRAELKAATECDCGRRLSRGVCCICDNDD